MIDIGPNLLQVVETVISGIVVLGIAYFLLRD